MDPQPSEPSLGKTILSPITWEFFNFIHCTSTYTYIYVHRHASGPLFCSQALWSILWEVPCYTLEPKVTAFLKESLDY